MLLIRRHLKWAGIILVYTVLFGCETKKPSATMAEARRVPVVSQPALPTVSPDQPMLSDTTISNNNQPSETEDVASLHEPFEEIKQVAPGLLLIINSIRPADTAIIRDPSYLKVVLTIKRNHKIIYRDTTNDGWTYDLYSMPETKNLYPIWVPTGGGNGDLLVAFSNRPSKELARRFCIRNGQVTKIVTLLAFDGPAKDWDKDGKLEFAGFYDYVEPLADDKGRTLVPYVPTLYYEVRPSGLVLDSALTEKKVRADYGVFL